MSDVRWIDMADLGGIDGWRGCVVRACMRLFRHSPILFVGSPSSSAVCTTPTKVGQNRQTQSPDHLESMNRPFPLACLQTQTGRGEQTRRPEVGGRRERERRERDKLEERSERPVDVQGAALGYEICRTPAGGLSVCSQGTFGQGVRAARVEWYDGGWRCGSWSCR